MALSKRWLRVERAAEALKNGQEFLALVRRHNKELIRAAERGVPPVSALSDALDGIEHASDLPVRQFVGMAVRALLEENGFEVALSGVRLKNDKVFRTGSVYKEKDTTADLKGDWAWFVKSIPEAEGRALWRLLTERFRE